MSLTDQIMASRRLAGRVRRYHTWPTIREQTVADHTWQVMRIYVELFGSPSPDVWEYILWHDSTEMHTGDIPFPVKRDNPELAAEICQLECRARQKMGIPYLDIPDPLKLRAKLCDLLEMREFGLEEQMLGNGYAFPIVTRTTWAASQVAEQLGLVAQVNKWMET